MDRGAFRDTVWARDHGECVICHQTAQDVHHILERRLFTDGGYDPNNGACLCGPHHLDAERTVLSCETIRMAAGIDRVVLPDSLDPQERYDKWGNPWLDDRRRMRGPLWQDESVQQVLVGEFTEYVKHPRMRHLPWSMGRTPDDLVMPTTAVLESACPRVVVTEKMDGENTTMYPDMIHARSVDGRSHPSRDWVKNLWASIKHDIPTSMRLCGENLFARHSIAYDRLPSYFMVHSIWEGPTCLSWDDTREWAALFGLALVPILYDGPLPERAVLDRLVRPGIEGYVIRTAGAFSMHAYPYHVGKYVRADHVQTQAHWTRTWVPNQLARG